MSTATQLYDVTQGRMCDCFRDPEFRWLRVLDLQSQGDRPEQYDDEWTEAALNVLQDRASDRRSGDIQQALAIWTDPDGPTRLELEARILTGASDITIAAAMDLPPAVVAAYQAIFFDVRPRLPLRDWILFRAIWRPFDRHRSPEIRENARSLKHLAYHCGPLALEIALAVLHERPLPVGVIRSSDPTARQDEADFRIKMKMLMDNHLTSIPTAAALADQAATPATKDNQKRNPSTQDDLLTVMMQFLTRVVPSRPTKSLKSKPAARRNKPTIAKTRNHDDLPVEEIKNEQP